jgi:hypothetical protein
MTSKSTVDLFLESMKSQETKKDYVDTIKRLMLWLESRKN